LAKEATEEIIWFDCFPSQQEFSGFISKIQQQLTILELENQPLSEIIAGMDPDSPYEDVVSLFLCTIKKIGSSKCLLLCSTVASVATQLDADNYETRFSESSETSSNEEIEESSEKRTSTIQGAVACMSNDIYKRVCDEFGYEKLYVIYCIKLFCNWLYRFDFSVANVDLNRFVNDSSV
jgi:hypothetical protein